MLLMRCRTEKKIRVQKDFTLKREERQMEKMKGTDAKEYIDEGKSGPSELSFTVRNTTESKLNISHRFSVRAWYHNGNIQR